MTPKDDIMTKIREDPDYVDLKRFNYSLKELLQRYPEGAPSRIIATGLRISEDELDEIYKGIILKLRAAMKVEVEDGE